MSANLQVVPTTNQSYTVEEIVSAIKEGTWKGVKKGIDLRSFFYEPLPNQYAVDQETRIQVRQYLINLEFVKKQVNKIKTSIDRGNPDYSGLEVPTFVYFSNDFIKNGKVIHEGGSTKVIGGNNGMSIRIELGIFESDANILDFEKHLDGKMSKLKGVANGLNDVFKEEQGLPDDDIKWEFYNLIDERIESGLEAKPTQEEQHDFLDRYSQINSATIANWIGHHETGGRRDAHKTWTKAELKAKVLEYDDNIAFDDFLKLGATTVAGYDGEMLGRLNKDATIARLKAEEENIPFHKKAIVTIYAGDAAQVLKIDTPEKRKVITDFIEHVRKTISFDEIKVEFLRYK
jgi:hypothetical protein